MPDIKRTLACHDLTSSIVSTEKITFEGDSRFASKDMFKDEVVFNQILRHWKDEMPGVYQFFYYKCTN